MKTVKHRFWGLFATTGGPACICTSNNLKEWSGSADENGLYWQATQSAEHNYFQIFLDKFYIFNTETGNFTLFRSDKSLIIAEIIYVEHEFAMPWDGIEFIIDEVEEFRINLKGKISIFDSSLSLYTSEEESFRAIDDAYNWNAAFVKGDFTSAKYVSFKNSLVNLYGILLS